MKKVVWTAVLIVVSVGMAAGSAWAQAPQDQRQARIERQQAQRDRIRARVESRVQARIDRVDRNRDGSVSRDEWAGAPKRFDRLDRNHDGVVSKDELVQRRVDRRMQARRAAGRHR